MPITENHTAAVEAPALTVACHSAETPAALAAAVQQFESPLLRYTAQILRQSPDLAQDVVQDTFLRLRQALARGKRIDRLSSWLFRVAHNLAIDVHRRSSRQVELVDDSTVAAELAAPAESDSLGRREAAQLAVAELQHLDPEQRQVLTLKLLEGMTLQEISDITGIKLGTVHYRLTQGLRAMSVRLREKGVVSSEG